MKLLERILQISTLVNISVCSIILDGQVKLAYQLDFTNNQDFREGAQVYLYYKNWPII